LKRDYGPANGGEHIAGVPFAVFVESWHR
jgi:hypothetical protein